MGEAGTGAGQYIGDVGPGIDMTATACLNDGEGGGVGGAALFGACAEAEAAGDNDLPIILPMSGRKSLSITVGTRSNSRSAVRAASIAPAP